MVLIIFLMNENTMALLRMINLMVMEFIIGQMVTDMKVIGLMTKKKEMVLFIVTIINTKEFGKMKNIMVMELI